MKNSPPQTELTTRRHISHLTAWYMMFRKLSLARWYALGSTQAGRDLSLEIGAAPHGQDLLERLPVVGRLVG